MKEVWEVEIKEIELPKGWCFKEDTDSLCLIDPEGIIRMRWTSSGPTKEDIQKDIDKFFGRKGQP